MANTININDAKTGRTYTLEFNRDTVRAMEMNGFKLDKVLEQPMTYVPRLFAGAFRMHHKGIKQKELDRLYALIGGGDEDQGKDKLVAALMEMYAETVNTLFDSEVGDDEGNISWEKNW